MSHFVSFENFERKCFVDYFYTFLWLFKIYFRLRFDNEHYCYRVIGKEREPIDVRRKYMVSFCLYMYVCVLF